jgi:hypothetical protein
LNLILEPKLSSSTPALCCDTSYPCVYKGLNVALILYSVYSCTRCIRVLVYVYSLLGAFLYWCTCTHCSVYSFTGVLLYSVYSCTLCTPVLLCTSCTLCTPVLCVLHVLCVLLYSVYSCTLCTPVLFVLLYSVYSCTRLFVYCCTLCTGIPGVVVYSYTLVLCVLVYSVYSCTS